MLGLKFLGLVSTAALGVVLTLAGLESGPKKGDTLQAFEPTHVTGADAGTQTCPVCKYGNLPAVQVWVNGEPTADVAKIASDLDKHMAALNGETLHLKTFVIFKSNEGKKIEAKLAALAKANGLNKVALTWLAPGNEALKEYQINSAAQTTILVYKNRQVTDKFINLKADKEGLMALDGAIAKITK
jgi:protocatechuate 3,4-dioxygenase, beta subunit